MAQGNDNYGRPRRMIGNMSGMFGGLSGLGNGNGFMQNDQQPEGYQRARGDGFRLNQGWRGGDASMGNGFNTNVGGMVGQGMEAGSSGFGGNVGRNDLMPDNFIRNDMVDRTDRPDKQMQGADMFGRGGNVDISALGQFMGDNASALSAGNPKGGIYGSMLTPEQEQMKAMMYGLSSGAFTPGQLQQARTGEAQSGYDPRKGFNAGIGNGTDGGKYSGLTLDVDTYGHGPDGQTLRANRVIRQMEDGTIPYPKGYNGQRQRGR